MARVQKLPRWEASHDQVDGVRQKRSDMTREQFKDYWVNKHSELERKVFARGRIKKISATFIGATLVGELSWDYLKVS